MRAAILTELRAPLVIAELALPALGVGQVLVRMQYAAICGAQLNEIDGAKGPDKYLPHLLGHEGVGTVEAIGPGVTTKAVGDRVICHWRPSDGIAAKGAVYAWNGKTVNSGPMTCFSTETIVSENRLTLLPDGLDPRVAPLFGCALTTAYGVVTNDAQVKPGDDVLVIGAGGVGLAIIQMAALCAADVLVVEPQTSKHDLALRCGAMTVIEDISRLCGSFDAVIDTTGRADVIAEAYELTAPQGTTVLVGVSHHDDPITIDAMPLHFGKRITGSQGGSCVPHRDIPKLARLVAAHKLNPRGLITDEYPFDDINEALDVARSGCAGRVLLRMDA